MSNENHDCIISENKQKLDTAKMSVRKGTPLEEVLISLRGQKRLRKPSRKVLENEEENEPEAKKARTDCNVKQKMKVSKTTYS